MKRRIAITGLASKVTRAGAVEHALQGKPADPAAIKSASARARSGEQPRSVGWVRPRVATWSIAKVSPKAFSIWTLSPTLRHISTRICAVPTWLV